MNFHEFSTNKHEFRHVNLLSLAEIIFIEALSSAFSLFDIANIIFAPPRGTEPVLLRSKLSAAFVFHFERIDLAVIKLAR